MDDMNAQQRGDDLGLTAVPGVRVGHHTLTERPTGCTVVLVEEGAVGGVDVRGSAPGTRESALLDPVNTIERVHAVVLSGGSAFGLDAASGVVRYLEERGIGFDVGVAKVPIVPAAILFDLNVGGRPEVRPGPECGYQAALAADEGAVETGSVGAGAGATVGKLMGMGRAMKSGVGTAQLILPNGLVVAALVVVNGVGDVVNPMTGRVVAGVRNSDGSSLADVRSLLRAGELSRLPFGSDRGEGDGTGQNTSLAVVTTNAGLTKPQATKVAQMAHDGLARTINPVHTPWDGDVIFALATGSLADSADLLVVGALAAEVVQDAVLNAVMSAEGLPDLPSARDLER